MNFYPLPAPPKTSENRPGIDPGAVNYITNIPEENRYDDLPPEGFATLSPIIYNPQTFAPMRRVSFNLPDTLFCGCFEQNPFTSPVECKSAMMDHFSLIIDGLIMQHPRNTHYDDQELQRQLNQVHVVVAAPIPEILDLSQATDEEAMQAFRSMSSDDEIEIVDD